MNEMAQGEECSWETDHKSRSPHLIVYIPCNGSYSSSLKFRNDCSKFLHSVWSEFSPSVICITIWNTQSRLGFVVNQWAFLSGCPTVSISRWIAWIISIIILFSFTSRLRSAVISSNKFCLTSKVSLVTNICDLRSKRLCVCRLSR